MLESLWLVHPDSEVCDAFRDRFVGLPNVCVVQARFEDLEPHDAFVTAGNAYGIMTAGIDAAVVRRFGADLMRRVQHHIQDAYYGEQPVGTAFVVATDDSTLPYIVHSPTMRTPGNIAGTDQVYAATWAALLAIAAHNQTSSRKIDVAGFPAMGTGFGGMPCSEAARQMAAAWRHFLDPPHRLDWETVTRRERAICYDGSARRC